VQELQSNFQFEQSQLVKFQKSAFEFKNEILNKEGLNESRAKFNILVKSIEFTNPNERHSGVYLEIKLGDERRNTNKQNNNFEWNQFFEL